MARLLTCGFEENDTTWTTTMWTGEAGTDSYDNTAGLVHSGVYSYKFNPTSSTANVYRGLAAYKTDGGLFARIYFKFTTRPNANCNIIAFQNSSSVMVLSVRFNSANNKLTVYNALSTTAVDSTEVIAADTWYRLEVRYLLSDTVGQFEARLYTGDNLETTTAIDTWGIGNFTGGNGTDEDTLNTNVSRIYIGAITTTSTCVGYIDDVALNDETGTFQTSWCGPGKICLLTPSGDTAVAWTKAGTPEATNWQGVDDVPGVPNDATDYNTDAQATNEDKLAITNMPAEVASGDTIVLLDVYGRVGSDSTSGTPALKFELWDEAAAKTAGPVVSCDVAGWRICATTEHYVYDATGKTKANIDSFSAGYIGNSADAKNKYISALWVNVEWNAAIEGGDVTIPTITETLSFGESLD